MILHLDCREGRYIKAQDPSKEPYMMKEKGPYEVISMQSCMDWCNKFETCSYFSFHKTGTNCFLFEVKFQDKDKYSKITSGPRFCSEMNILHLNTNQPSKF